MLNNPFCRGEPGRRHVREQMRLESQGEAQVYYWRCPACHRTTDIFKREPIESDLMCRDQVAIVVESELFDRELAGRWHGPYLIQCEHDDRRPYTATMQIRRLAP
jgi:hypothetical protein